MYDWRIFATIAALGLVSYALRSTGFLAAGLMREDSPVARFLHLAPGNLFVAFVAATCLEGGWANIAGCIAALLGMFATRREWFALAAGFLAAAIAAEVLHSY